MAPSGRWCRTAGAPSDTPGWTQAGTETEERRDSPGLGTARRTGGSVCTPGRGPDTTDSGETGRAGSTAGTESTGEAGDAGEAVEAGDAGEAGVGSRLTDCQGS